MVSILLAYFRTTRIQIAALIYFLLAGGLTQLPLFNYLGFEFSAIMTIPTAFISGILTIQFLREHRVKPLTRRTWLFVIADYLNINFLLLLIPVIVISLNAFVVKNCAYWTGLSYYLLLPVCTMIFSVSLALIAGTIFRKAMTMYTILVAVMLSHIVVITYTQPQLFAYNFVLGFFPGITYDELLSDMKSLIMFREFTLIASLMLIALFSILVGRYEAKDKFSVNYKFIKKNFHNDTILWFGVCVCAVVLVTGHVYRDRLGFEFAEQDIQNNLGRRSESRHFIFHFHNDDYTAMEMRRIKAIAEFHFRKVSDILKTRNEFPHRITVYIYPNNEWKLRFIGTSTTNIAKPWKQEIHLTKNTFEQTFRHELVHALAADFGFPVIRASTHMAMNEGLAVAVDWDEGIFTPHQYAAALQRENALENAARLFTYTGFAMQTSSYSYLVSGSFCRYLIDRFGIERFQRAFPNGNFVQYFGESVESLVKDWKAFLNTVDASELSRETVQALFFQQSIFYKICAREVAEQNQRAVQAIRVKNYSVAESEFNASYSNAPTVYSLRGIFQSLNSQSKAKDVIKKFSEINTASSLRTNPSILLLLADAYYLDGDTERALNLYRGIRSMNFSESYIEAVTVRKQMILDRIDSKVFSKLYYSGSNDSTKRNIIDSVKLTVVNSIALQYFDAIVDTDTSQKRIDIFKTIASRSLSNELKYFSLIHAADLLFTQHYYEDAKSIYWQAKNFVPVSSLSMYLDERVELCDFVSLEMQ